MSSLSPFTQPQGNLPQLNLFNCNKGFPVFGDNKSVSGDHSDQSTSKIVDDENKLFEVMHLKNGKLYTKKDNTYIGELDEDFLIKKKDKYVGELDEDFLIKKKFEVTETDYEFDNNTQPKFTYNDVKMSNGIDDNWSDISDPKFSQHDIKRQQAYLKPQNGDISDRDFNKSSSNKSYTVNNTSANEFLNSIKELNMDKNMTIIVKYNHQNMKEVRKYKFY